MTWFCFPFCILHYRQLPPNYGKKSTNTASLLALYTPKILHMVKKITDDNLSAKISSAER